MPGDHLQLWQLILINRDITAKLKQHPEDLKRWQQVMINELRRVLVESA